MCSRLTVTDCTQSLTPMSMASRTSPVRRSKIYTTPWSLPLTSALPPSWNATFLDLRSLEGTGKVLTLSVVDSLYSAMPCATSSRIIASSFILITAWPLSGYQTSLWIDMGWTHITVDVGKFCITVPFSLRTYLIRNVNMQSVPCWSWSRFKLTWLHLLFRRSIFQVHVG